MSLYRNSIVRSMLTSAPAIVSANFAWNGLGLNGNPNGTSRSKSYRAASRRGAQYGVESGASATRSVDSHGTARPGWIAPASGTQIGPSADGPSPGMVKPENFTDLNV